MPYHELEQKKYVECEYKRAINAANIVAITDPKGVITFVNDNFCKISQYAASELIGQTHSVVNSGYHSRRFFADMWATISSGKIWRGEIRNRAKDGSFYWVETTIVPFLDEQRQIEQYMSVRTDITDRKIAKDQKFHMLFDHSLDGLTIGRPDGTILEVNDAFCTMLGYSRDELLHLRRQDITIPDDPDLLAGLHSRTHTGSYKGPLKFRRKDGTVIDTEVSTSRYTDENGEACTYVSISDITEKLRAEQALRASEHKLLAMIAFGQDIIVLIAADGRIKYRSPSYALLLGYVEEESSGEMVFDKVHPDDIPALKADFGRLMSAPGASARSRWRQRHGDGSYRWLEGTGSNMLHDPDINAIICNYRDITEHVEAQQQVEKSNRELNRLFNSVDEVLYSAERNPYKLTQMSDACLKVYGYSPEEFFAGDGNLWYDVVLDEDKYIIENVAAALETGAPVTRQYRIRHRDGSIRWIEASVSPVLDDAGKLIAIHGANRDVTERRKVKEALMHSEKRFRALIEKNSDGIALTNSDRNIIYISPSIRSILGYEPEELIGTKSYDLLHPEENEETHKLLQSLASGEIRSIHIEMKARHKDGSWRWLDMTSTNMSDDPAIAAVVSNFRDITEKKKSDEALVNSEKRFRALIEHNHDGIALVDSDLRLIYLSPSVEQLSGFRLEELNGMMALDLVHPDDVADNLEIIASLARGEALRISRLLRIRHRDGSWRWIEGTVSNQLSDSAVHAIVANFRDVTERKKAEDELEQLNASLERKVEERTLELLESNKAMESFSYTAAHDLQGPLRVLSGYAALLRREYSHRMDEDGLSLLDTITSKANQMSRLVSDLLRFSRSSHAIVNRSEMNMTDLVRSIADQHSIVSGGPISLDIRVHGLGTASGDPGLMQQVWENLISNAIKYSGKQENPLIHIRRTDTEEEATFSISDNGVGFDMAKADRLFQVFHRLHPGTEFEGTGVGLALVRNIIVRHGGRIWAESTPGQGATFYFTLPL